MDDSTITFNNFAANEPGYNEELCVMMRKSAGYKWNDGMCDQSFRALCETAPVSYYLMVQCCFLFITVQPPYFAPPGGHKIKTAK